METLAPLLDRITEMTQARTCPFCGAEGGEPCRTRRTRRLVPYGMHAAREADLWEAYRIGRERQRLIRA